MRKIMRFWSYLPCPPYQRDGGSVQHSMFLVQCLMNLFQPLTVHFSFLSQLKILPQVNSPDLFVIGQFLRSTLFQDLTLE